MGVKGRGAPRFESSSRSGKTLFPCLRATRNLPAVKPSAVAAVRFARRLDKELVRGIADELVSELAQELGDELSHEPGDEPSREPG
jgi:hypothetical protein